MNDRHQIARRICLAVGGIGGAIVCGMLVANYAVGGMDPFYAAHRQPGWSPPGNEVAIVHDDPYLPSASVAATSPYAPTRADPAMFAPAEDWRATEARAQREMDRLLASIDNAPPEPAADVALTEPVQLVPTPTPTPPPAGPTAPVTPGNTLIY